MRYAQSVLVLQHKHVGTLGTETRETMRSAGSNAAAATTVRAEPTNKTHFGTIKNIRDETEEAYAWMQHVGLTRRDIEGQRRRRTMIVRVSYPQSVRQILAASAR